MIIASLTAISCTYIYREAWNVCGKMSADLAMQLYVEELQQVLISVVIM